MADVAIDASGDEGRRLLEGDQRHVVPAGVRFPPRLQCTRAGNGQNGGQDEQGPGYELMPGEGAAKPDVDMEQRQRQNGLPGQKAVEAVGTGRGQRGPRQIGDARSPHDEAGQFDDGSCFHFCCISANVCTPCHSILRTSSVGVAPWLSAFSGITCGLWCF